MAGAKLNGIPPGVVDQVFSAFEPFAPYGFNKAHALCFGLIAYQTAYLKANYPGEFMTASLNGFRERAEKVAAVGAECRRVGGGGRAPPGQGSQSLVAGGTPWGRGARAGCAVRSAVEEGWRGGGA